LFGADVAHAHNMYELLKNDIRAAEVYGDTPKEERKILIEKIRNGEIDCLFNNLVSVEGFDVPHLSFAVIARPTRSLGLYCLSDDTEVLTKNGWKNYSNISVGDSIYSLNTNKTSSIEEDKVIGYIRRPLEDDEYFVELNSPTLNFKITNKHSIIYRTRTQKKYSKAPAQNLTNKSFYIPISGIEKSKGVNITDDELRFIGWFLSDGTINKEKPRGVDKHLSGWERLEKFIDKDLSPNLEPITHDQLLVLLEAIHLGDGRKGEGPGWKRRSYHISTGNKVFAERLQSLCVRRGFKCNIHVDYYNTNPLYTMHIKNTQERSIQKSKDGKKHIVKSSVQDKFCWCVQTNNGTIITRRNGQVSILGNCQMIGRVLRTSKDKKDAIIVDVYDKMKIKQSRITFADVADKGDMYGEHKRANNILTADLSWREIEGSGPKKNPDSDSVAKALMNFPVFMAHEDQTRWTTDDDFMPITSWVLAPDQRLITWTEEKLVNKLVDKTTWKALKAKPTRSLVRTMPINVKHHQYGEGKIVDVGFGLEVKVEFNSDGWMSGRKEFIPFNELKVKQTFQEIAPSQDKRKVDRVFYLCFPKDVSKGRLVEMTRSKYDLLVHKDERMSRDDARKYLVDAAQNANVLHLVRSDARWKKSPISDGQRRLLDNWILGGKIRFDLDLNNMNKGDASAIIEQVKWQHVINEKFGAKTKDKLLGYDSSAEDV
jgi:hypothetical protein